MPNARIQVRETVLFISQLLSAVVVFSLIGILTRRVALYLNHTLCNTAFYLDTSIRLLTNFKFSWQISKAIFLFTYS